LVGLRDRPGARVRRSGCRGLPVAVGLVQRRRTDWSTPSRMWPRPMRPKYFTVRALFLW
jgi:hypothetical protein